MFPNSLLKNKYLARKLTITVTVPEKMLERESFSKARQDMLLILHHHRSHCQQEMLQKKDYLGK